MRYVRMLTNAMAAGALAATYLTVLLLQLNPRLPLASAELGAWFRVMLSFYGLHLSIAIFVLLVIRDLLAARALAPAWISVRLLAWIAAILAAAAAAGSWLTRAVTSRFRKAAKIPSRPIVRIFSQHATANAVKSGWKWLVYRQGLGSEAVGQYAAL